MNTPNSIKGFILRAFFEELRELDKHLRWVKEDLKDLRAELYRYHQFTEEHIERLTQQVNTQGQQIMAFQNDLDAIAARLQAAQDATDAAKAAADVAKNEADTAAANATDAESKVDAAVQAATAAAAKVDAVDAKAQAALDEVAALVATLKGNPPPTP